MAKTKVAVSLDATLLTQVDRLVRKGAFESRSAAVEAALRSQLKGVRDRAYEKMLEQIDPAEEVALAEEWLIGETF